jgi:FecR protein
VEALNGKDQTMPTFRPHLFAAAGLAALIVAAPLAAEAVGVTAVVRNNVQVTTAARPVLHKAAVRETISTGNDIVTGGQSMTQLLLLDKTSFTVGANARVKIDRFVFDARANQSAVSATVAKGAFRFMSGTGINKGKERSSLRTPVATIGIRGTIVEGVVGADAIRIARAAGGVPRAVVADPETATLIVLRGPGRNAQGAARGAIDIEAGGVTIPVEDAGMAVFIPGAGQQPIGPFPLSGKGTAMLRDMLGPRPLPGGAPGWQPDPTTDREFECSGSQVPGSGCPVQD